MKKTGIFSGRYPISVLYVDDEQDYLKIGKIFLERFGDCKVDTMTSGYEALKSSLLKSYDIIVSDYMMPGMDGITLLKEVRSQYRNLPFILFTVKGSEEVIIDAENNGVDYYIQKRGEPISQFTELIHKIEDAINKRKTNE